MTDKLKPASSASTSDLVAASKSSALARAMSSLGEAAQPASLADALRATPDESLPAALPGAMRSSLAHAFQGPGAPTLLEKTAHDLPTLVRAPKPQKIASATDLGSLVRAARRTMGLSQQAFADLAGAGRRFVSELESGKPTLEFDKVLKVCAAAGVDIAASMRSPS